MTSMTGAGHPRHERLQSYLDGRMSGADRRRFEDELAQDPTTRDELDAVQQLNAAIHDAVQADLEELGPTDLESRLRLALDREDQAQPAFPKLPPPRRQWMRWVTAAAAVTVLGSLFVFLTRPTPLDAPLQDLPAIVAERMQDYDQGRLELARRTADHAQLEWFFAEQGIAFPTRVLDLDMMSFRLVGGSRTELSGRTAAAFVYLGPEGREILCQMYLGKMEELPPTADIREHDGIRFHSYTVGGVAMTFWREGDVICVLSSKGALEDVVALAFAKAMAV